MFLSLLLALLPVPQTHVHVVDAAAGPGADFTRLRDAVEAAAPGDIVLVREGNYAFAADELFLSDKRLTVVAERDALVRAGTAFVLSSSPDTWNLFQGIRCESNFETAHVQASGAVWFERGTFDAQASPNGSQGFVATDCASLVLIDCHAFSPFLGFGGTTGLAATRSALHLHGTTVEGRVTGDQELGQQALVLLQSQAEFLGSQVLGAPGNNGSPFVPDGGDGGDGLFLTGASTARVLDSQLVGGTAGAPFGSGSPGLPGQPVIVADGTLVNLAGVAPQLSVTSPVRAGEDVALHLAGAPGTVFVVDYALDPGPGLAHPALKGEFLLPVPGARLALRATLPPEGELTIVVPAPAVPGANEGVVLFLQALTRTPGQPGLVVSSPTALVLLAPGT